MAWVGVGSQLEHEANFNFMLAPSNWKLVDEAPTAQLALDKSTKHAGHPGRPNAKNGLCS